MEEGKGCLIQCSTNPNITCITGRYDYTCPGHIHWGLVYFAVMLAFKGEVGQEAIEFEQKAKVELENSVCNVQM